MSWITRRLNQIATRWTPSGSKDAWGKISAWTRTSIPVRWEDVKEKYTTRDGREVVSRSAVYLAADIIEGDYLYLGTSTQTSPFSQTSAYEVKYFASSPSLTGGTDAAKERKAYL